MMNVYSDRWKHEEFATVDGELSEVGLQWADALPNLSELMALEIYTFWMRHGNGHAPSLDNIVKANREVKLHGGGAYKVMPPLLEEHHVTDKSVGRKFIEQMKKGVSDES